jgi:dihydroflavonol-4-reductase
VILVTGGAGFLGSHLVARLLELDQSVRVLERPDAQVNHLPLDEIELVYADIRDEAAVKKAMRGCRQVYHLAADPNLWRKNPGEFDAVNYRGTVNVVRYALESHAERIVYCSTESILTSLAFSGGAVENLRLKEGDMLGPYCLSKYHAERFVLELAEEGAPIVVVSPTLPIGPGDRNLTPPTRMTVAFCRGKLPAYLDCQMNLIDARDVAAGMVAAMARGRTRIRYLLGGVNLRLSEWLHILAAETGQPAPQWKVPYALALGVAWLSEGWATHVSGKMPIVTLTGVRLTRRCMYFDPSASLAELVIALRPITESARDAVRWYREQGWI